MQKKQLSIDPALLVPLDLFTADLPMIVDIAYTQPAPKSFCGVIYRPEARLWLHADLAQIVVHAAAAAGRDGFHLVLYDGLRTTEAQQLMRESAVVQANPQWLEGATRMLSPPGRGAHPRGMAIDVSLQDQAGQLLDMGTAFDEMPPHGAGPGPESNAAHRETTLVDAAAQENRARLDRYMKEGALRAGRFIMPLPQEWWDYRFMPMDYDPYAPLADADLPRQMRMTDSALDALGPDDFDAAHFGRWREKLLRGAA